jgi:hypothetical protein
MAKFIALTLIVAACLCFTCDKNTAPIAASLCNIRDKPEKFAGRTVQAGGWIFTDLEQA